MGGRVGAKAELTIKVVGVCGLAAHVVRRDKQLVEAVMRRDSWVKILEELTAFENKYQFTDGQMSWSVPVNNQILFRKIYFI